MHPSDGDRFYNIADFSYYENFNIRVTQNNFFPDISGKTLTEKAYGITPTVEFQITKHNHHADL